MGQNQGAIRGGDICGGGGGGLLGTEGFMSVFVRPHTLVMRLAYRWKLCWALWMRVLC